VRITENFTYPTDRGEIDPMQVSIFLNTTGPVNYVQLDFSQLTPRIRLQDLGTLIGMLEAIKRRAGA
jgi:hypothetical protein